MSADKTRVFRLFGDEVSVTYTYNDEHEIFLGQYPDFSETPRYTPCGRPWVNVVNESCTLAEDEYGDCGSCRHLKTEKPGDLIGVCSHDEKRVHLRE